MINWSIAISAQTFLLKLNLYFNLISYLPNSIILFKKHKPCFKISKLFVIYLYNFRNLHILTLSFNSYFYLSLYSYLFVYLFIFSFFSFHSIICNLNHLSYHPTFLPILIIIIFSSYNNFFSYLSISSHLRSSTDFLSKLCQQVLSFFQAHLAQESSAQKYLCFIQNKVAQSYIIAILIIETSDQIVNCSLSLSAYNKIQHLKQLSFVQLFIQFKITLRIVMGKKKVSLLTLIIFMNLSYLYPFSVVKNLKSKIFTDSSKYFRDKFKAFLKKYIKQQNEQLFALSKFE
ncbi:transmembrane protein, putative (macronuclear) [Tetrahymena thermophila SB210]|uniref:Transmembrane protein, putative n=1 Tax=Tetrahymena thermophila (strain SB210) TaxID=312017 RepID=W7WYA8_TETTS|nr:transmembrane protein, putative [Tetrahymena thermophila SB210]EWS71840.1 transmembrane protein, putative [Tetrahymena thermophila SB210]|eukprot:XP_012655633.1 transmembrane protein, putative [Tetrahymena thermophila SB210]